MKTVNIVLFLVLVILVAVSFQAANRLGVNPLRGLLGGREVTGELEADGEETALPPPARAGEVSVEEAIFQRRSVRSFADRPLSLAEVSQLLWSAAGKTVDGVTGPTRAHPSAGGTYPLEILLVAGRVEDLSPGIYRYSWRNHSLTKIKPGDFRDELRQACLGQRMVGQAPASLVLTAVAERAVRRYGERARRYIPMDIGGAGQNVHLQAEGLELGTVIVGAFNDEALKKILELAGGEEPFYVMPVGRPGR